VYLFLLFMHDMIHGGVIWTTCALKASRLQDNRNDQWKEKRKRSKVHSNVLRFDDLDSAGSALERRFPFAAQKIISRSRDSFRNTRRHVYIRLLLNRNEWRRRTTRNLKICTRTSDRDNSKEFFFLRIISIACTCTKNKEINMSRSRSLETRRVYSFPR